MVVSFTDLISKVNGISIFYKHISFSSTYLGDDAFAAGESLENPSPSYMISMDMRVHW